MAAIRLAADLSPMRSPGNLEFRQAIKIRHGADHALVYQHLDQPVPSPSISIPGRIVPDRFFALSRAIETAGTYRATASPSIWTISEPQTGQCSGISTIGASAGRFSGTTFTTCGITSPARRINTVSRYERPGVGSHPYCAGSRLDTVTPPTNTGFRRATGVIARFGPIPHLQ